jgi:hypothetical protein
MESKSFGKSAPNGVDSEMSGVAYLGGRKPGWVIKSYITTQPGLLFFDLWDAMLTPDGKPREDLWVADHLHPNHAGYPLPVKIMRPLLGGPEQRVQ